MKKTKRITALLICAVMIFSLAACQSSTSITTQSSFSTFEEDGTPGTANTASSNNNKNKNNNNNKNNTNSNNNNKNNTLEDKYQGSTNKNENLDLGGESIRIGAIWNVEPGKSGTSTAATLTRERIDYLEKKYNCKFEFLILNDNEMPERIRTSVAAGKPYCDFMILYTSAIPSYAYNGYLQNIDKITAMNLKDTKWNSGAVSNGAFNGGHYTFSIGSAVPRFVIAFNKTLFDKNPAWGNPYKLYYNNQWTWDKLMDIAAKATDKTSGRYGFGGLEIATSSIIASYGGSIVSIDKNGKPAFTGDSNECRQAISFITDMQGKYKNYIWTPSSYTWTSYINALSEGKVAMAVTQLYMIRENILEMEDDYGIVPIPKGSNSKGRYASVQEDIPTWVMLANNPLAQEKGYILDLYTEPYKGYEDIISKAELETYCRDNDSVKILLDVEKKYGLFNYATWFSEANSKYGEALEKVTSKSATFSEAMGSAKGAIQASIKEVYNSWQE